MRFNFYDLYCDFINSLKNLPKRLKFNFLSFSAAFKAFIKNFNFIDFVKKLVRAIIRPRLPFTLYGMLFRSFLYWYVMIQGLFVVILLIFDLFGKLDKYMSNPVSILDILAITALFIPKTIGLTIPVAIMF
ncbi:MAG TPA: LptF/LptG family permease, partial [Spirochaetota bacterium]|nr:LptF/LptG family permease [Spirochaetota bacterium]